MINLNFRNFNFSIFLNFSDYYKWILTSSSIFLFAIFLLITKDHLNLLWKWKPEFSQISADFILQHQKYELNCNSLLCPSEIPLNTPGLLGPTIYFITPTYQRRSQVADLVRLGQTLRSVSNLVWIVIEDSYEKSAAIAGVLRRSCVHHIHLKSNAYKNIGNTIDKGNAARQQGLDWIRDKLDQKKVADGVLYLGDDDNTYDVHLFDYMRQVKRVGIWPVGLVIGGIIEMPLLKDGKVYGWHTINPNRKYCVDMASFAVNVQWFSKLSDVTISGCSLHRDIESCFMDQMKVEPRDLEVYAMDNNQVKRALVWHTKTWTWPGPLKTARGYIV